LAKIKKIAFAQKKTPCGPRTPDVNTPSPSGGDAATARTGSGNAEGSVKIRGIDGQARRLFMARLVRFGLWFMLFDIDDI
jgi:hypothetical protein